MRRRPGPARGATVAMQVLDSQREAAMRPEPTVYIVDDDEGMRQSLRWLAESVGLPVRAFATAEEFLSACGPHWRGCALVDLRMPGMSGVELQRVMQERGIGLPVVFVTAHGEVPVAVEAIKRGALDFIEKPFSGQRVLDSIRLALQLDRRRRRGRARRAVISRRMATLTPREREVLALVVAGRTSRWIAEHLGLTEKTVELHRSHVNRKMKVRNAVQLVRILEETSRRPP